MDDKWVWDIETYPECFSFAVVRADGKFPNAFEVSFRKNEVNRIFACLDYIHAQNDYMVGFNSLQFDYPVIHKLLGIRSLAMKMTGLEIANKVYEFAQEQIDSMKDGFGNIVKTDERYTKQIDLFKIWHFDNKAKMTSLKMLEFNMREHNIEDLPYPVGAKLNSEQIDTLLKYNLHDVKMTLAFYNKSLTQVEFREKLSEKYGRDFINHNDTKIGKDFFCMRLQECGIATHKQVGRQRKLNQTIRPFIKIRDCLFDYYDFKRPEFIAVKDWLSKQIIKETKGVFSDIEENKLGDVANYAEMVVKKVKCKNGEPTRSEYDEFKREHPVGWVEKVPLKAKKKGEIQYSYYYKWKIAETLNVVINGFRFDFGVGGIHGSMSSKIVSQSETHELIDADV